MTDIIVIQDDTPTVDVLINSEIQVTVNEIGLRGAKGDIGLTGVKGDTGLTGAKGDTGLTGESANHSLLSNLNSDDHTQYLNITRADLRFYIKSEIDNLLNAKADLIAGLIPANQLPSFVDDILEYSNILMFPNTGESGKIYLAIDSGKIYRWTGSLYAQAGNDLELGEIQTTAYRGDRGKIAYDHTLDLNSNPHATNINQVVNYPTDINGRLSLENFDSVASGEYYSNSNPLQSVFATLLLTSNSLRANPFFVHKDYNVDEFRFSIPVVGSAGSRTIFGIYSSSLIGGRLYPTNLITSFSPIDSTVLGIRTINQTITIPRGWYWLTYNCNEVGTEPTFRSLPLSASPVIGYDSLLNTTVAFTSYIATRTYTGTLDSVFPISGVARATGVVAVAMLMRRA